MAQNLIKYINKNNIHFMRNYRTLNPMIELKSFLSSDKPNVDSKQLEIFEQKLERHMKEKVLDRQTHTGQTFSENDYRLTRFVGKQKEINPRFAIDLIAEVPPIPSKEGWISCDGGGGPLGHPKVFINLEDPGEYGTCGYCGLRFFKEEHSHH